MGNAAIFDQLCFSSITVLTKQIKQIKLNILWKLCSQDAGSEGGVPHKPATAILAQVEVFEDFLADLKLLCYRKFHARGFKSALRF